MKNYKIFMLHLIFTILTLINFSCKNNKNPNCTGKWDERLHFKNNSNGNIYAIHSNGYPDTLTNSILKFAKRRVSYFRSGELNFIPEFCDWEDYYSNIPSGLLMIHIFANPNNNYESNINNIVKYPLLKRYDLSLSDLQAMNWTVTYP